MPIRLNQIAKEFHITLNEIACFLQEKYGICVTSLNDTITEEQYAEMCAHYRRDKVYHEIVKNKYRKWKKEKELYTEEETDVLNEFEKNAPLKYKKIKIKKYKKRFKEYAQFISIPFGGMKKR